TVMFVQADPRGTRGSRLLAFDQARYRQDATRDWRRGGCECNSAEAILCVTESRHRSDNYRRPRRRWSTRPPEPTGGDEMSTTGSPPPVTQQELDQVERGDATTGKIGRASISEREHREIEAANASGNTPVVFIHGLWLLPSSWAAWADFFQQAGYAPLTPDWPDD